MSQKGRNAGLTGLVDLPGLGTGQKFEVRVNGWAPRLNGAVRPRRGRGGGVFRTVRWMFSGGGITLRGKPRLDGWPSPDAWKGQAGTVTVQVYTGKTISYPILVTEMGFTYDERTQDLPDVVLAAELTGAPTYTGWIGTQPTATDPAKADQQQWEGTSLTMDPQGLASGTTTTIDIWGTLTDTDAAEQTKLAAVIAAAVAPLTTPHNVKIRSATFARDAIDGGTVTIQWGLTDTAEDVVNPATFTKTDPEGLQSAASVAQIGSEPATPASLADRGTTTRELNDSKTLYTKEAGTRTTEEDVTFPGTVTEADVSELRDKGTITRVTSSGTAPAVPTAPEGQHVRTVTEQLTSAPTAQWRHTFHYANNTAKQDEEFAGTESQNDPSDLEDAETVRVVTGSSTVPIDGSLAATLSGLVVRKTVSQRIGGTPEKWRHTRHYGVRTTEQDITYPGTDTKDDASDLSDEKRITIVDDSTPVAPSVPVGYKLAETTFERLTDAGKWKYTYHYRRRTNKEAIEFDGSLIGTDPSSLADLHRTVLVEGASVASTTPPSAPTGLVLRRKSSVQIHDAIGDDGLTPAPKWKNTYEYARRTEAQDVTFPGTVTRDDQSNIADEATITIIDDATPVAPGTPTGMKLVDIRDEQLTDAGLFQWTYTYKRRTNQEAIEFDGSERTVDASSLADTYTAVRVQATSVYDAVTPATGPGAPSGMKLRDSSSKQIHDASTGAKWRNTYSYARRNREDDIEQGGTVYQEDESDLKSTAQVAVVEADGTPDGGVTVSGLVQTHVTKKQLHDSKWEITYHFAELTNEQEVTFAGTITFEDPEAIASKATVTLVNSSSTYPVALDTPPTGLKVRDIRSERLTDAGKWKHTAEYGLRTTEEDITYLKSRSTAEPGTIRQEELVVELTASATPDPTGKNPDATNLDYFATSSHRLTDTLWAHSHEFKPFSVTDSLIYDDTLYTDDPQGMRGDGEIRVVIDTSLTTSAPSVTNRECVRIERRKVSKTKYRHVFKYAYRTTQQQLEADKTRTTYDPANLEDERFTADVHQVSAPPSDPASPDASHLKLISKVDLPAPNPLYAIRIYQWGKRTSLDELELKQTWTEVDPEGLASKAQAAKVDATPTLPAGFVERATRTIPLTQGLGTNHELQVIEGSLTSTAEELEYRQGSGEAHGEGYENTVAEVVAHSGTAQALADSLYAANQADATFEGARVVKITADKALQILRYTGGDKSFRNGSNHVSAEYVRGVPQGALVSGQWLPGNISTGTTAAWVYIRKITGQDLIFARPLMIHRARGSFIYRRIWATNDMTTKQFLALRGTCANAYMFGYSTGEVMYAGPVTAFTYSISGVRRLIVDYQFMTDQWKFFEDGYLPLGQTSVNSGTISASQLVPSSQLEAGHGVAFPRAMDFSEFTA